MNLSPCRCRHGARDHLNGRAMCMVGLDQDETWCECHQYRPTGNLRRAVRDALQRVVIRVRPA